MKPIIKWAGGKTQLLDEIKSRMPNSYKKYIEPFFGGGALYFELAPTKAIINDLNIELVNLYKVVKDSPEILIDELDNHQVHHCEEYYQFIRDDFNTRINHPGKLGIKDAAELIYLNKMGFNGLYRVNKNGFYNVPSGHRKKCVLYDRDNILAVSRTLKNTTIRCEDFESTCLKARKGDFVFFDSPYFNTFDTYQKGGFEVLDHVRLRETFDKLTKKGVFCMLTNSNDEFIKDLYKEYKIDIVSVKRMINCDGKKRTGEEVIITNY